MKHLISEMKPVLAEIIRQGIDMGQIRFDYPAALAEIALIVLTVKLNDSDSSGPEESEETIRGLISLLEKGTENPAGKPEFPDELKKSLGSRTGHTAQLPRDFSV